MATDKARLKEITDIIKIHCNIAFDDNYYKTTKGLINKLKKNKEFSMDSGKVEGWISGLLYVVGEDSNLFDTGNWMRDKIYLSKTDLANGVGVSVSTMRSRANQIREALPENAKFIADIKDDVEYDDAHDLYKDDKFDNMKEIFDRWTDKIRKQEEYQLYMKKARKSNSYEDALNYVDLALNCAKEQIGEEFDTLKGQLWMEEKARPYMMIKEELAYIYTLAEDYKKAIKVYEEMLELNSDDNQGVRYMLLSLLIQEKEFDKADKLIEKYKDDESTSMLYTKSLYYFVKKEEASAKLFLNEAFEKNIYVPLYLLGMKQVESYLPEEFISGSEEEAMCYFEENVDAWISDTDSLYWLIDEYFDYLNKKSIKVGYSKENAKKIVTQALDMME